MKNRNENKPSICRIASLNGFQGVLLGRDLGGIFKEGHVYEAIEIMGEIIIKDLGEHALGRKGGTISTHATDGVVMLTKREYLNQIESLKH